MKRWEIEEKIIYLQILNDLGEDRPEIIEQRKGWIEYYEKRLKHENYEDRDEIRD